MDADRDDTAGAEVGLVQGEARTASTAPLSRPPCLRIRRPWLLLLCQAESFLLCRSGGRGVPSDQATMEPIGALSKIGCADMMSSCSWWWKRRRDQPAAVIGVRKKAGYSAASRKLSAASSSMSSSTKPCAGSIVPAPASSSSLTVFCVSHALSAAASGANSAAGWTKCPSLKCSTSAARVSLTRWRGRTGRVLARRLERRTGQAREEFLRAHIGEEPVGADRAAGDERQNARLADVLAAGEHIHEHAAGRDAQPVPVEGELAVLRRTASPHGGRNGRPNRKSPPAPESTRTFCPAKASTSSAISVSSSIGARTSASCSASVRRSPIISIPCASHRDAASPPCRRHRRRSRVLAPSSPPGMR